MSGLRPVQTDGAAASAKALGDGKADLAIIRGDLDVPKNAQAVATLRKNVAVLWVPPRAKGKGKKAGPKITKIAQLAGRRIGVVGRTQANVNLLKVILQQYGVDPGQGRDRPVSGQRGRRRHPQPEGGRLSRRRTGQQQDHRGCDRRIDARRRHADIPRDRFGRGDRAEPSDLRGVRNSRRRLWRLARPARRRGQDDQLLPPHRRAQRPVGIDHRRLYPAVVRDPPAVDDEFPLAAKIETPDTDKDAAIPVHPGAAAFVDGEEKTFLDRYSDYIWWGLMALSAMGSAGAWFAGYLKKDERNNNSSLRERLLDMLAAARRSDSIEELDRMQSEADDILRDTLHCFEHGAIEEGALTAFNIALEQFHNAVADRKALLISMPQNLQRAGAQFRAAGTFVDGTSL